MEEKKIKKFSILLFLLAILVILGGCTESNDKKASSEDNGVSINETGFPIVDEKITISMLGKKTPSQPEWKDMSSFIAYEEMTNIHIDWTTPPSNGFGEKFNLLLAGDGYPEAFFAADISQSDQIKYGSEGILIPLEDLIENYAPNFKKLMDEHPEIRQSITAPDGHIYALPHYRDVPRDLTGYKMWINKKWIEEAGLDMPKTVDELYTVLKAFKERNSDIIPMGSAGFNDIKRALLGAFGYLGDNHLNIVDDEVVFVPATDGYKEFLQFMNTLYKEGLLDEEAFLQDREQLKAKGQNMRLGMFTDNGAFLIVPEEESWDYVVLPPLTSSVNNQQMWPAITGVVHGAFAITDKNKHPEASMRYVDYFYSDEGGTFLSNPGGVEGVDWEWTDETKSKFKEIVAEGKTNSEMNNERTPASGSRPPYYRSKEWVHKEDSPLNNHIDNEVMEKLSEHFKISFPDIYFTSDQNTELNALKTDIESYVEQMQANFVVGKASFDEWSDYIDTLNKMGLDRLVKINQEAYDIWNEN
ncbi:extracellular solute-binding protein [Lederbergia ruris]|uniref:extracellular solute-binding protein n=1 Tax=Lederbergia ruris TaxID=217495 RepID=UPI00130DF62F